MKASFDPVDELLDAEYSMILGVMIDNQKVVLARIGSPAKK